MSRSSYHCEYAWLGGDSVAANVAVDVSDGLITHVQQNAKRASGSTFLRGVTIPGLANAHSHAFHRALRARTHSDGGTFWTWRDQMYALANRLTPDTYYLLARATFAEMVGAGITCVGEFHYLHHNAKGVPYSDPNAMSHALVAAAADAGLRMTLLDTCYLRGGVDASGSDIARNEVQERFSDGSAEVWVERVEAMASSIAIGGSVRLGAAIHSVRAVDPTSIRHIASWTASRDAILHAHVSEQPAENEQCMRAYGQTPVELLAEAGALSPRFCAVHATHLLSRDFALLSESGSAVCLCPTTERDLADGIGPTEAFRSNQIPVSLGSDSHAVVDFFEEARAVEMGERVLTNNRGAHTPAELLHAATVNGHRALGWESAGQIAVGGIADLVSISADSVRLAPLLEASALAAIVYCASPADVHHVVSHGRVVVSEFQHQTLDVVRELRESILAVTS